MAARRHAWAWGLAAVVIFGAASAVRAGGPAQPEPRLSDRARRAWSAALLWRASVECGSDDGRVIRVPAWDDELHRWSRLEASVGACELYGANVGPLLLLGSELATVGGHFDGLPTGGFEPEAWSERAVETDSAMLFGVPLWTRPIAGVEWYGLDPEALRRAFHRLYLPPGTDLEGIAAQALYDVTLREDVARLAGRMARVSTQQSRFAQAARQLADALRRDPDFSVYEIAEGLAEELNQPYPSADDDDERIDMFVAGQLLRRQLDGSLPVIRQAVRTILRDYDPETFRRLSDRL